MFREELKTRKERKMPKINTIIEGFDDMSVEEQLAAVRALDIPEKVNLADYVKKSVFDAKASEASELSKKLKSQMSDEDKEKEDMKEQIAALQEKYDTLSATHNETLKEIRIAQYKANFIAQGYDEALAQETANALEAGEMDKVLANNKRFADALSAKIKADLMKGDPHPSGGVGGKAEDVAIQKAKEIGKAKAEQRKITDDVMKHYI